MTDLLGQQVQLFFSTLADAMEHIKAGRIRALGVTTATRVPVLPDVPAIAEFLPSYEAVGWLGVAAPKDTPPAIIEMLNKAINAGLADPKVSAGIATSAMSRCHCHQLSSGSFWPMIPRSGPRR